MTVYLRELDELGEMPMERAIGKMRDEVTGVAMLRHNGHNRELAMVMTKLDEAKQWAIEYAIKTGRLAIVDRTEVIKAVTDTTDTTDRNGASAHV